MNTPRKYQTMLSSLGLSLDKSIFSEKSGYCFYTLRIKSSDITTLKKLKKAKIELPERLSLSKLLNRKDELIGMILWLSPDEFLVIFDGNKGFEIVDTIEQTIKKSNAILLDVSGAYSFFSLQGNKGQDTLSQLCYYDLTDLTENKVISSVLLQAPMIFFRTGRLESSKLSTIHLLVRNSFAVYVHKIIKKSIKNIS